MENFQENKIFGDVFCRYLKKRFDWNYASVDPQKFDIPEGYSDVDVVLSSKEKEPLYLQLKQPIDFEECHRLMTKSSLKIFGNRPFEVAVKKAEEKYTNRDENISNIILILHIGLGNGYSIPEDDFFINKEKFEESAFRGIYFVSPTHELWDAEHGKEIQNAFVSEIKNAFSGP